MISKIMLKGLIFNVNREGYVMARTVGPYRIAHVLRQEGWDIEVVDFFTYWTLDELKTLTITREPANLKFIGFGFFFIFKSEVFDDYTKWLKETYPHIIIIVGSMAQYPYNSPQIDYNISGYGELSILALLKYLYSNGDRPKFSLSFNSGKHIPGNTYYPSYPMNSLMVKYEDRDFLLPEEWLGIELSRGCKFKCDFCNFPVLGVKGDYSRDAKDFKEQLQDTYDRFGNQYYYTSDETFNDSVEKITKFANVVETLEFDTFFTGFVRVDLMISRKEEKEELLRMNYLGHWYGVESFNHKSAKSIGKGMHPDKIKQGLIDIKNYFQSHKSYRYRGTLSMIIGLPYETEETINDSIRWFKENWQGQSVMPWPLEIFQSEFDEKSKISLNYKKYGYRKMNLTDSEIQELSKVLISSSDSFLWENDYMNVVDAYRINNNFKNFLLDPSNDFRLNSYFLGNVGLSKNLDERLSIKMNLNEKNLIKSKISFIKEYKEKKLNY